MSNASPPDLPVALVDVEPSDVTPGVLARIPVRITSRLSVPATFALEVVGLDPEWVKTPPPFGPVGPGEQATAEIFVTVPLGHPASELRSSLRANVLTTGEAANHDAVRPGAADLLVTVGDGSMIGAVLEPPEVRGAWRGSFDLVLFNRAKSPSRVDLDAHSPDPKVRVSFGRETDILEPSREVRIRARVEARRPFIGSPRRRPFSVRVQGRTTPVSVEGTFHQRALIGASITRIVAVVAVLGLWAAVAVVGINALNSRLHREATNHANATSPPPPSPSQPSGSPGTGSSGSSGSGSSGASGSGASGSGASGSGGSGSGGSGSGSSGSGGAGSGSSGSGASGSSGSGSSGGGSGSSGAGVTGGTTRVSGKLNAAQPGAVTVRIAPTSLVNEAAQGANLASQVTGAIHDPVQLVGYSKAANGVGKVYGAFADPTTFSVLTAASVPALTTATTPDGSWAFTGVKAPGYYLVTFSKAGYATENYAISVSADGQPVTLSASIGAGAGAISGSVLGPSGPLGNADVTITDGTVTVHERTPSVGPVGKWSVSGLTTPDTYLVTAADPGYSTQTSLVTLGASGNTTGVNLTMQAGQGSLTGTVTSSRTTSGVGGVTVTASNGSMSRSASTTTTNPVGTYALPDLPVPGTYTLTVSGEGWVSQTQEVQLNGNEVVNATLTPSGADVNGVVSGSKGGGLAGAGLVLSNDTNTFKTLSESAPPAGGFDFGEIPPGQYVLTATEFGYTTKSAEVTVGPGQTQTTNLALTFVGQASENTATIQGSVQDLFNAEPLGPPLHQVSLQLDHTATTITTNNQGNYVIPNVAPGVHTVTAAAAGFESASVSVNVALGQVEFAPTISLPKLDTVAGQVRSNAGGFVPNPCAQLTDPTNTAKVLYESAACTTSSPVPDPTLAGIPPAAQGGFEIDDVPHGNYDLILSASGKVGCNTGAGFQSNVDQPIPVSLSLDTDLVLTGSLSPALNLGPVFNVVTLQDVAGGGIPTQIGGVTVTATDQITGAQTTCKSPTPPPSGSPPTATVVPGLNSGDPYVATFLAPNGATAPPIDFTAQPNNSTVDTALLYTPPSVGKVTIQFNYGLSGASRACLELTTAAPPCPASPDLSQVQLTGTVGYSISAPGQPAAPIQRTFLAIPGNDGTWSFDPSDISQLLPSASVTFSITDPIGAFQAFLNTVSPTGTGAIPAQLFTLTPASVTIANGSPVGSISPASGVTVTVSPPIQGASIIDNAGNLQWSTTSTSVPAVPGVYLLTFTAPAFDSQTATYAVPFFPGSPFPTIGPITLTPHLALTVTPTFTPQPNLAFPTVYLFDTSSGTPVQLAKQTLSATALSAVFSNLSVQDSYRVTIRGPGFATSNTAVTLPLDQTITPALRPEGFITGTLAGAINTAQSPLAGVTVTATLATPPAGSTCPADTDNPPATTTAADGSFTIVGDPSTNDGGLCNGATYNISASIPGYTLPATAVSISSTGANAAPALIAVANQIVQKVTVKDQSGNAVNGLVITDFSAVGSPVSVHPEADGITFDLTIDPTSYTFVFNATGYTPLNLGPIPYTPGESPPIQAVTMSLNKNTITGTVTTAGPGGTTVPLSGVSVSLFPDKPGAKAFTSVLTNAKGVYTLTDEGKTLDYIPDGTYILGAALPGYGYLQQPQAFQTTLPNTIVNVALSANSVGVSIAMSSTLGSKSDLTGATVTLTPVTPPGATQACGSSQLVPGLGIAQSVNVASSSAAFNQVVPDVYTLGASDTGHPAQSSTTLTVCPDGSTSPTPAGFEFQEGQVSGTVDLPTGSGLLATNAAVQLFTGSGATGVGQPLSVSCSTTSSSCAIGTFAAIVPLGSAYTVQASMTGLDTQTATTPVLSGSSAAKASASVDLNLPATPREVDVTTQSGGSPPVNLTNGTVTLSLPAGSQPYTGTKQTYTATIVGGVAKVLGVAPSASNYDIALTGTAVSASGAVAVPIGTGTVTGTATGTFGELTGTVTLSPPPTASTGVTAIVCADAAGCATPIVTQKITIDSSGSTSYVMQLPASSGDVVTFSATGYVAQSTTSLAVTDGGSTSVPTITLSTPPPTTTTTTVKGP